ncbi:UrvD/REP family ATP-dependent DNA helicase [Curtobacterium ammoniigenes]|uniref:UrvD/REP family ATP-dependent DNA helicase n=1 Tax=Curtobacterium ammoniigenes TaxID=395387 RepID=UPI0008310BFB|nr:UrvD/REP family ATP-dependent DNA helicase [Curtobacterium ammoniigenes]
MLSTVSEPTAAHEHSATDGAWIADAAQRRVIDLPAGRHAAVIGAPGSGKTTTLIRLVRARLDAAFVDRGADASAPGLPVLALTTSRQAATALRDDLAAAIGRVTNGALARTINALAFHIVGHERALRGAEAPVLLTGPEQDAIIADLLAGDIADATGPQWPDHIGPAVRERAEFRTALRDLMMRATAAWIEPETMRSLGALHERDEWIAAAAFIDDYRAATALFRSSHLDAAALVAFATAAVDRGVLPPAMHQTELVVVDDAQELVDGEIDLLRALARRGIQIVAFGDPDITAGAYRGAQPAFLGGFAARLGADSAEEIILRSVYRHPAPIRATVRAITDRIGTAAAGAQRRAVSPDAQCQSAPGGDPDGRNRSDRSTLRSAAAPVVHLASPTRSVLIGAVARVLRERHLYDGVPWDRMAVVTRSSAAIPDLVRALAASEVPATAASAAARPRSDAVVAALIDVAAVALGLVSLDAPRAVQLLLGPLGGLDALALRRLRLALRTEELAGGGRRSPDELLVEALEGPDRFVTIDAGFARRAGRFSAMLATAREAVVAGSTAEEILWSIWDRSGLAGALGEQSASGASAGAEADRHLDSVVALFAAARRFAERDPDALARSFFDEILGSDLPEDAIAPQHSSDRVRVLTPAATTGLEVDVVAVLGLQDGTWPNLRVRGSLLDPDGLVRAARGESTTVEDDRASVIHDELRLFARAVSRARSQVLIGAVVSDDEAPSPFLRLVDVPPERVSESSALSLRGVAGTLRRRLVASGDRHAAAALARLAAEGVPGADPADWWGTAELTTDAALADLTSAPVAVSPSQIEAFERCPLHWFLNKYGGGAPTAAMGLGTIIHAALEEATSADAESLWGVVERRWHELQFESPWIEARERRRARRMVDGLSDYLSVAEREGRSVIGAEIRFAVEHGAAALHGSIDRIEAHPDGSLSVVDLKTGATMPAMPSMPTHAQLAAYQFAVREGAVDGAPVGAPLRDARLVFVQKSNRSRHFNERVQHGFDDEQHAEFGDRLQRVAAGMADRTFIAKVDEHCTADQLGAPCSAHIVGEITW